MLSVLDARPLLQHTMGTVVGVFACVLNAWKHRAPVFWNVRTVKSSLSLLELRLVFAMGVQIHVSTDDVSEPIAQPEGLALGNEQTTLLGVQYSICTTNKCFQLSL